MLRRKRHRSANFRGALACKAVVARRAAKTMEDCGVGEEIKSK